MVTAAVAISPAIGHQPDPKSPAKNPISKGVRVSQRRARQKRRGCDFFSPLAAYVSAIDLTRGPRGVACWARVGGRQGGRSHGERATRVRDGHRQRQATTSVSKLRQLYYRGHVVGARERALCAKRLVVRVVRLRVRDIGLLCGRAYGTLIRPPLSAGTFGHAGLADRF